MEVSIIVFLAIMLHKGPAAFGLVSFLLHECIDKSRIRRYLLLFSLSAPFFSLSTFGFLFHTSNSKSDFDATGILLLMSAGTFLFVATVHILPEIATSNSGDRSGQNLLTSREVIAFICGTAFPFIFRISHSH
ncbi:unnamed protein product [Soboliphyme baturini]|uniref:Zinc transporter ZIP9 n=1 Tax=Soboliphyme baturini TaxID=241478 RepID=A0A183ISY4_9BILA|nr:unnamed protein product [Soboliphyme baturini]